MLFLRYNKKKFYNLKSISISVENLKKNIPKYFILMEKPKKNHHNSQVY